MILKKEYFIVVLVLVTFLSLMSMQSFAQSPGNSRAYYVNLSGDDKNPGTKIAPFKTIEEVNSLHLVAGDTVYFRSGDVFNGSINC